MRTGISLTVTPAIRRHLKAVAANRNSPQKHVWRAQIVLLSAAGVGTNEIMRQTGKSKTCVWRWQERFMAEGFDGLLHDKTRPSRVAPLGADVAERVVALTQSDPPAETTHWTAPMMAKEIGISASSVQRIWHAHGLQPHRFRRFKLSNDPNFVEKLRDVVGLYVDPPGAPTRPPHCPGCREPMKFVKAIPQLGALPELFVFHCTRCNQAETIMQDRY
jgi:transposase